MVRTTRAYIESASSRTFFIALIYLRSNMKTNKNVLCRAIDIYSPEVLTFFFFSEVIIPFCFVYLYNFSCKMLFSKKVKPFVHFACRKMTQSISSNGKNQDNQIEGDEGVADERAEQRFKKTILMFLCLNNYRNLHMSYSLLFGAIHAKTSIEKYS